MLFPAVIIEPVFLISFQLVILFGREGNQEANMGALLRMITTTTLSRASADLWNHTDAVHGCLALLGATFKKTPHLLTSNPSHLAPLFHLGKKSKLYTLDFVIAFPGFCVFPFFFPSVLIFYYYMNWFLLLIFFIFFY